MTTVTDGPSGGTSNGFDTDTLNDIASATISADTATTFTLSDISAIGSITFSGTGFTYDANGQPTGGTVTGYTDFFGQQWTDMSVSLSALWTAVKADDPNTLTSLLFGGDDTFNITHGADGYSGYGGNDTFNITLTGPFGPSFLSGGDGDDVMNFSSDSSHAFTFIDGGAGMDTINLDGNISADLGFVTNIEKFVLTAGHSYNLGGNGSNLVAAGQSMTVDGSALGASDVLGYFGEFAVHGDLTIIGGAGNDFLVAGGHKVGITGGAGDDRLGSSGGIVTLDGGDGNDTANYASGQGDVRLSLTATAFQTIGTDLGRVKLISVENITGSPNSDRLTDNSGANAISGGDGNDTLYVDHGGVDTVDGGTGNDLIVFKGAYTSADTVDGGFANDTLSLSGDYSAGVAFTNTNLMDVETILLGAGHSYTLSISDPDHSSAFTLNGSHLRAGDTLYFDGSGQVYGTYTLEGGSGSDTLIGGGGGNIYQGGNGADHLVGSDGNGIDHFVGADTFIYNHVKESTSVNFDTITDFNASADEIQLTYGLSGIGTAVTAGRLSEASFNGDLARAIGADQLHAHHAILFTASSGDFAGDTFLVIDFNRVAGYQAGADFVIRLDEATHMTSFGAGDFV